MASSIPDGCLIGANHAGYEAMPHLESATPGGPKIDLETLCPFDAAILGWSSYSHLRSQQLRIQALRSFARVTEGPILVSFFARSDPPDEPVKPCGLRRFVP